MEALDERTLDAIATIICGDDSTYYRRAADLAVFFRRAGWEDVPDYDGDSRRSWTFAHLRRRREDTAAIGRVLLRLADRREYPNDPDAAEEARERVNRVLAAENLHVAYGVDRRPLLEEGLEPAPAPQDDLSRKKLLYSIEDIVTDRRLVPLLNQRIAEIAACRANACYLAATILLGSLLEGLLLDAAESRPIPEEIWDEPEAKEKNVRKPRTSKDWTLHSLSYVAQRLHWIDMDAYKIVDALRHFRNLVHANEQRSVIGEVPDADTVDMYWPVVIGAINDLGRTRPGTTHPPSRNTADSAGPWTTVSTR